MAATTTMESTTTVEPTAAMETSSAMEATSVESGMSVEPSIMEARAPVESPVVETIQRPVVKSGDERTTFPEAESGTEGMVKVSAEAKEKGRIDEQHGRIESPTKWAVKDAVSRDEGIAAKPRVPIPTGSGPEARSVGLGLIGVGFRQILGT